MKLNGTSASGDMTKEVSSSQSLPFIKDKGKVLLTQNRGEKSVGTTKNEEYGTLRNDIQISTTDITNSRPKLPQFQQDLNNPSDVSKFNFKKNSKREIPLENEMDNTLKTNVNKFDTKGLNIDLKRLETSILNKQMFQNTKMSGKFSVNKLQGDTPRTIDKYCDSERRITLQGHLIQSERNNILRRQIYKLKNYQMLQKLKEEVLTTNFDGEHQSQIDNLHKKARESNKFRPEPDHFEDLRNSTYLRFDPRIQLIRELTNRSLNSYKQVVNHKSVSIVSREMEEFMQEQDIKLKKKKEEERLRQGCRVSYDNLRDKHLNKYS